MREGSTQMEGVDAGWRARLEGEKTWGKLDHKEKEGKAKGKATRKYENI